MSNAEIMNFVYENARRYPGVVGFPFVPLNTKGGGEYDGDREGPTLQTLDERYIYHPQIDRPPALQHSHYRTAYVIAGALMDKSVWEKGGKAIESNFNIDRPYDVKPFAATKDKRLPAHLKDLKNIDVAWAHPATIPDVTNPLSNVDKRSRGCPGKDMSISLVYNFFLAWKEVQASYKHADPTKVHTEDHTDGAGSSANHPIEFMDVTPFVPEFILVKGKIKEVPETGGPIEAGARGCKSDADCSNHRGEKSMAEGVRPRCYGDDQTLKDGRGRCRAIGGSLSDFMPSNADG
jgi:hypothetical protein